MDSNATSGSALVLRMDTQNNEIADRYFFPTIELIRDKRKRSEKALPELEPYRIKDLSALYVLI